MAEAIQQPRDDGNEDGKAPEAGIFISRAVASSHTDSDDQKGLRTSKLKESDENEDEKYKAKPSPDHAGTSTSSAKEKAAGQKEAVPLMAWYRHSGEDAIDEIPIKLHLRVTDEDSLEADVGDNFITHMSVWGRVPALDKLAPRVSHLEIDSLSSNRLEQLQCLSSLKCLEVLCLRNCDFSAGLPRVITKLTSLKSLSLEGCELSTLPTSLYTLQNLEVLCLKNCDFSPGLPDVISRLASLKSLSLHRCELSTLPSSLSKLIGLEVLDISMNKLSTVRSFFYRLKNLMSRSNSGISSFPDSLSKLMKLKVLDLSFNKLATVPDFVYKLKNLKSLNLHHTRISSAPDLLSKLTELEVLDISMNQLSTVPSFVCKLKNLKSLNLHHTSISSLPDSLSELTRLEFLDVSRNLLSTVPRIVYNLRSLRNLNLSDTGISSLPDFLSELIKLEVLDISMNQLSSVPGIVSYPKNLKSLDLSNTGISSLSDSLSELAKLEVLVVRGNQLSTVPGVVCNLTSLQNLNLSDTGISSLPDSLSALKKLEKLDISDNGFKVLPSTIYKLTSLQELRINRNINLKMIGIELLKLESLKIVDCGECKGLVSPPYYVCSQGLIAIKKYFIDLEAESVELIVMPVAVTGESMAGKTSIVRTLQAGERVLTSKRDVSSADEATKVFKMEDLSLDNAKVKFVDFGGHEIYQIAYQYMIKDDCLPLLVVNMKSYHDLASKRESTEATRRVCFDWISHLYLRCPRLGAPLLVLTHKDQLSDAEFDFRKRELRMTAENIRLQVLKEQLLSGNLSDFSQILHLANTDIPLFHSNDIFEFGNDPNETKNIEAFKEHLSKRCEMFRIIIPALWKRIAEFIRNQSDKSYLLLSDILAEFPGNNQEVVLRYLHSVGEIMWFENIDSLSGYIFHQIPAVTEMIALLFNHRADDLWDQRRARFSPIRYKNRIIEKEEYVEFVRKFLETGVMHEAVLLHLFERESQFSSDIALRLLLAFYIVHGPIVKGPDTWYLIPAISSVFLEKPLKNDSRLRLSVDILFEGLSLPKYVYQLITVALLRLQSDCTNTIIANKNGAIINHGSGTTHFEHDFNANKITINILTNIEHLGPSWKNLIYLIQHIIQQTKVEWKATRPVCIFYCSHCTFIQHENPDRQVNPPWFRCQPSQDVTDESQVTAYRDVEPVACRNALDGSSIHSVPLPLRFPCYELTNDEISMLKSYLSTLQQPRDQTAAPGETGPPAIADAHRPVHNLNRQDEDDVDSDLSDIEDRGYVNFNDSTNHILSLRLTSTRRRDVKELFENTEKVYKMSSPSRGRALIINIRELSDGQESSTTRHGSQYDYYNISTLFKSMNFELAKFEAQLTNLKAEEILSEIREETQRPEHHSLGAFVLVIMSRGWRDHIIYGSDYKPVDLVKVKDLLSPAHFPAMTGKPKLIVIQSDAGGRTDLGDLITSTPLNLAPPPSSGVPPPPHGNILNVDDFFLMKACEESYVATRSNSHGSWFIRLLVATFYKHAGHRDVESLFKIIQSRVREANISYTQRTGLAKVGGNVPISHCTFTNFRKFYFFPGYNGKR